MKVPINIPRSIKVFCLLVLMTGGALVLMGSAESPGQMAIAWVDLDKISRLAKPVQQVIEETEEAVKPHKETIEKKMSQLDVLRYTYEQQKSILSEEQRKTREKEILELQKEIEDLSNKINQQLGELEKEKLAPVYDRVMATIKKVAQRKGIKIVLTREMIVWGEPTLDITDAVINELNAERPTPQPTQVDKSLSEKDSIEGIIKVSGTPTPTPEPSIQSNTETKDVSTSKTFTW